MELKQIKELMATMGRTGTKKLTLKKEGFEIELEREDSGSFRHSDGSLAAFDFAEESSYRSGSSERANAALLRGKELSAPLTGSVAAEDSREAALYITSPMVGTYYSAGTPEDAAFVKVGDKVEKNSVVCIIEAMKVMNEVKAGIAGTIMEVLVENGNPVEFGTKLFRIS
ncbi:MAG: acetyl-CoA carboxylase biotin carboxyl carrier protein [Parachlamydiaceae bacterium]|nr:acetyl-CoA carboxylase biotin carboxyl carrier protein [Parachlamydiaceae bacterium]